MNCGTGDGGGRRYGLTACLARCLHSTLGVMPLPTTPITLNPEAVADLNQKLSELRHAINGSLALIVAASELIRIRPDSAARMMATMVEQPDKIKQLMNGFSAEFEKSLGITRP